MTPEQKDIDWTENLIAMINDGGTWGVPMSLSTFTFFHSKKEYTFFGDKENETNQRVIKVLIFLGWKERGGNETSKA